MSRAFRCLIGLHRWVWESWLTCSFQPDDRQLCAHCFKYRDAR